MKEVTESIFKSMLEQLQNNPSIHINGAFIHSAPAGNMFRSSFCEKVWLIDEQPAFMTKSEADLPELFFIAESLLKA